MPSGGLDLTHDSAVVLKGAFESRPLVSSRKSIPLWGRSGLTRDTGVIPTTWMQVGDCNARSVKDAGEPSVSAS